MKKIKLASLVDINKLYEQSVQSADAEIDFINRTYKSIFGRLPKVLREDFSGTSMLSVGWVNFSRGNYAIGVDIDKDVLSWARHHNVATLTEMQKDRIELLHDDVIQVNSRCADVIGAFNFSYWVFKQRATLLTYFKNCYQHLNQDGIFILDAFGGSDAYVEQKERTKHKKFTYVWHQAKFKPVTNELLCHIGFEFPDGSSIPKAFTYDCRLWTLPELVELLLEAGFKIAEVYWEKEDKNGQGTGYYKAVSSGTNDTAWVVYLVARKNS
jgi:SAM-dependent methyltransferase